MPRKPRRRITGAKITFLSLVPRGANQMPVLYKADDNTIQFDTIIKDDDFAEKGELTAIVYVPEVTDSQGDIASAEVVKNMAYDFARRGLGDIDLRHDGKPVTKDQAHIAESFLVQKSDPRFEDLKDYSGNPVNTDGAWAVVMKINDSGLRQLYKDGKWNGVSMFGNATVKAASDDGDTDNLVTRFIKALASLGGSTNSDGELDMEKTELTSILEKNNESLVGAITKGIAVAMSKNEHDADTLKKAGVEESDSPEVINLKVELLKAKNNGKPEGKPEGKPSDKNTKLEAPVFKGDAADPKAVADFELAVKKHAILKDMDATDPASVIKANEALAELAKVEKGEPAANESDEMKQLRERLVKAERGTNQPSNVGHPSGLSKEDDECLQMGREIAAHANGDLDTLAKIRKGERVA